MQKSLKYVFLLACFAAAQAQAQDTLFLRAKAYTDAVTVTFFPLNPTVWAQNLGMSYQIERVEMDETGEQELPATRTVVAASILPQDAAWFEQHKTEEQGLMQAVGALLHDTTFQFKDKSLIDPDAMRWNYVTYEVLNRPRVALACGSMFADTLAEVGKTYRYTVRPTDAGSRIGSASVVIAHGAGAEAQSPPERELNFVFPENRSLTDMIPRLEKPVFPQVFALARAYGDSIVVRWAPSSAALWTASNRRGYLLIRIEDTEGDTSRTGLDTLGVILPWSKEKTLDWVEKDGSDSLALVAAGILYNEGNAAAGLPLSEQAQVFESKFGFALFAAESSQLAAKLLGLGYADKNVKPGKTYKYSVMAFEAQSPFSRADVSVKNERTTPPSPVGFLAKPGDRVIELVWEISGNARHFSAYQLERSEAGGGSWQKLHERPLTFVSSEEVPLDAYRFLDSVAQNFKEYRYRLRGLDSFGEWSPWSELTAQALDLTPPTTPAITFCEYNDTTNVTQIQWRSEDLPQDFKAFHVVVAAEVEGNYDTIAQLPSLARQFAWKPDTLLTGDRGYFFRILAMDLHGNAARSHERYVTVPDLVPPPPPARVAGFIDDDGTVTIVWEHSTAKDVEGYWVYAANRPKEEFPILNREILTDNTYSWKVADVSLNEFLYVVVTAEDSHFNRGKASQTLRLERPDKVAPVTPHAQSAVQQGSKVVVKWRRSVSEDTRRQFLLRRMSGKISGGSATENAHRWALLDSLDASVSSFVDEGCEIDRQYEYALFAEDEKGNRSDTSNAVTVRLKFTPEAVMVNDLEARQSAPEVAAVILSWEFEPPAAEVLGNLDTPPASKGEPESAPQSPPAPKGERAQPSGYPLSVGSGSGGDAASGSPLGAGGASGVGNYEFLIFRSSGNDNPDYLATVSGSQRSYEDAEVMNGVVYNYAVQVNFFEANKKGERSPMKSVLTVGKNPVKPVRREELQEEIAGDEPKSSEKDKPSDPAAPAKPAAEIRLQGKGLTILHGDTEPSAADGTDFGEVGTGGVLGHEFQLQNIGGQALQLPEKPVVLEGGDPEQSGQALTAWAIIQPKNRVKVVGSEPFIIEFRPRSEGEFSVKVKVLGEKPYEFTVRGVGVPTPELDVFGKGISIQNGDPSPSSADDTDFGGVQVGSTSSREFLVKNQGTQPLRFAAPPKLEGDPAFSIASFSMPAGNTLPPGGELRLSVIFAPKETGARNAKLTLASNDADENPFAFAIQGVGGGAEIGLQSEANQPIEDGAANPSTSNGTDFGKVAVGASYARVFVIQNSGDRALNLTGRPRIAISGAHSGDFKILEEPPAEVKPGGGEVAFTVVFKPGARGLRKATVTVENSDANESRYDFAIQGTGAALPELSVFGKNDLEISAGDNSPSLDDETDFGTATAALPTRVSFKIANAGEADLHLTGVLIEGVHAADFRLTRQPDPTVPGGGGRTVFVLEFKPGGKGVRSATVRIGSDDLNDNPFEFSIRGTGQ